MSNSSKLLFPESVKISDVPGVGMGSSEIGSLRSVVVSSSGSSSLVSDVFSPVIDLVSVPSSSVVDVSLVGSSE